MLSRDAALMARCPSGFAALPQLLAEDVRVDVVGTVLRDREVDLLVERPVAVPREGPGEELADLGRVAAEGAAAPGA
eukprot:CAMPEP_0195123446 /NCGR_PEP_ID=MMETSP0448-20130528/128695_1 /TAXON_ID=66468 /ORGANISM="Heterocapsa triquestra, Strain CCMP 448" /LENGTH=76 /DNA_ID=CAMNT_0040160995 /DNA_START=8 /DNA_END=236 /DNA_ORIENTATION=+